MYVVQKINLNRTLAIDSPFQTFVVERIYRIALPVLSPETLSSSSKSIFLYNAHLALFVRMDDTITRTNASVSNVI